MKFKILTLALLGTVMSSAQAADWGYKGQHGPDHWGELAPECSKGKNQSPIDIGESLEADLADLNIAYKGQVTEITNNGHTLQAKVVGENTFTIDGVEFSLAQFHFHTPSENTINNKHFPLEAHFVNTDSQGNLAVIAVMFNRSESKNTSLEKLLDDVSNEDGTNALTEDFKVADLLPKSGQYHRFNGSLTTPPCSEGVRWFVLKEAKNMSADQISQFEEAMGHNNRPVQPLNARKVMSN
ncbi:carbonic anhydrase [Vibrio japonicus]|uniref:Carbonic anhydrase n=1 Tax=Vibrio japonicus TaxID=1824638 RepID=A0ABY5LN64_9VIBR|nr:carbonic anhydrase family protein [Vibrio japonicus]UUM32876.1 carbonic anhydrase family protein [Vibrio japonicus]